MKTTNKFCHNCGIKLIPTAKFCGECGTSQSSLSAKPPEAEPVVEKKKKPIASYTPSIANGGDDDDDDSYVDHLDHLNVSISSLEVDFGRPNAAKETFAGVIAQGAALGQNADSFTRPAGETVTDSKAFLQQFQQEAGTLRNK
jgi:hypothetical protein